MGVKEQINDEVDSNYDADEANDTEEGSEMLDEDITDDLNDEDELKHPVDDDEEEEDEGDDDDIKPAKKHMHGYHQVQENSEIRIVHPSKRVTSEYLTLYELTMIIGTRATHISKGSVIFTETEGLTDPRDIARKEIYENKCPLSITRKTSATTMEVWSVNEMIKPDIKK